jgi:signal transduction histidine kinase
MDLASVERKDLDAEVKQPQPDGVHAQMRALHRATLSLFADLSLDGVLRRITYAAKELANASYAALGIPDEEGGLETFVTVGMSEEEIREIPHPPIGEGLIGEMMRTGESIRIPEIGDHPKAVGFPAGHPEMHSFLGVPIAAYGRPLGQIYLTDKQGTPAFTADDQRLIEMLAAHAAAAIENARLYRQVLSNEAELAQRNEQLELINDLASGLISTMELEDMLERILERVIGIFAAGWGEIHLAEEEGRFRMALPGGHGNRSYWDLQEFERGQGFLGRVVEEGEILEATDLERDAPHLAEGVLASGYGTVVGVPLFTRGRVVGVLSLGFFGTRDFSERERGLLEAVGAAFGLGVENARLNRQARRLAVLEERERIGMDLHDGIIQSIYAVGLTLESTRGLGEEDPGEASELLGQAIDALNATIKDIRSYILDLQPSRFEDTDLQESLLRLSCEFEANSHVELDVRLDPEALNAFEPRQERVLLRIAQEALANVAKHSRASRAWLHVRRTGDQVLLQVIDNGQGFDPERTAQRLGHGLPNMRQRANRIGAEFETVSSPGEGTTITVRLDVASDPPAS